MDNPTLPYDVIENMIHYSAEDKTLLWLLMKTSKAFSLVCRRYLYAEVQVSCSSEGSDPTSPQPASKFYLLLVECPYVRPHVRTLDLYFGSRRLSSRYITLLTLILPSLIGLEHLELYELCDPSQSLVLALRNGLQSIRLRELSIRGSRRFPIMQLLDGPTPPKIMAFSSGPMVTFCIPPGLAGLRQGTQITLTCLELVERHSGAAVDPTKLKALYLEARSPFDITKLQTLKLDILRIWNLEYVQSIQTIVNLAKPTLRELHLSCAPVHLTQGSPCNPPHVLPPLDLSGLEFLRDLILLFPNYTSLAYGSDNMDWVADTLRSNIRIESLTLIFSTHVPLGNQRIDTNLLMPMLVSYQRLRKLTVVCPHQPLVSDFRRQIQEMLFLPKRVEVDVFAPAKPWNHDVNLS